MALSICAYVLDYVFPGMVGESRLGTRKTVGVDDGSCADSWKTQLVVVARRLFKTLSLGLNQRSS